MMAFVATRHAPPPPPPPPPPPAPRPASKPGRRACRRRRPTPLAAPLEAPSEIRPETRSRDATGWRRWRRGRRRRRRRGGRHCRRDRRRRRRAAAAPAAAASAGTARSGADRRPDHDARASPARRADLSGPRGQRPLTGLVDSRSRGGHRRLRRVRQGAAVARIRFSIARRSRR